ncbi:MAG: Gfo/Idh/MocA family oxidoreductase [Firmicutes bacterium]|nr:Gfo/Idh/MocA family oxidoreductase [Bacillota bacterium]
MRVCVIGSTGHVGYVLKDIGKTEASIVGVAPGSQGEDVRALYAEVRALNSQAKAFADYRQMLDELKPDVAVVTCHFGDLASVTIEALQRQIHVFSEKPIATTLSALDDVQKAYSKAGVHLAAMFGIRYEPCFLTAWDAVRNGVIGQVRLLTAQKSYKLGQRPDFFKDRKTYGGTIPWVGIHAIDWVHWFSGEQFLSVFAAHSSLHNRNHGELEVTANCQFNLTNQVIASVNIDYLRPENAPSHGDDRVRVVGTEGIMEVRGGNAYLLNADNDGIHGLSLRSGRGIFSDFMAQVRGEGECLVSAEDSFYVTKAALLARLSADEGRSIRFGHDG